MILWTIQPEEVLRLIKRTGVYRCDAEKAGTDDFCPVQYDWLADQMRRRIGSPPEGVSYPVWAWQRWYGRRKRPDLRALRWHWGGESRMNFYRLEIDIPEEQVLLSDYRAWGVMLNNGLLSDTEKEDGELGKIYKSLSPDAQREMKYKNWERVFDITPVEDEWTGRGEVVQATFWELRKEQIRKTTMFITEVRR